MSFIPFCVVNIVVITSHFNPYQFVFQDFLIIFTLSSSIQFKLIIILGHIHYNVMHCFFSNEILYQNSTYVAQRFNLIIIIIFLLFNVVLPKTMTGRVNTSRCTS